MYGITRKLVRTNNNSSNGVITTGIWQGYLQIRAKAAILVCANSEMLYTDVLVVVANIEENLLKCTEFVGNVEVRYQKEKRST